NGGERTPMIAHWPAGIHLPAGSLVPTRAHVIDLMPTILSVAGAKMPERFADAAPHALQGISLGPLFQAQSGTQIDRALFGEHEGGRSVISADGWKLIRDRDERQWHLYDLNTDQTELNDRINEEPERAAKMQ